MLKLLLIILIFFGWHGCSFIQSKFGNKQDQRPQNQEENQEQQQKQSEPIPVNPQHS